jgi:hypothetical protein
MQNASGNLQIMKVSMEILRPCYEKKKQDGAYVSPQTRVFIANHAVYFVEHGSMKEEGRHKFIS